MAENKQEKEESRGPEPGEAFGMAAVTQALRGIDFPIKKEELIQKVGDREVQFYKDGQAIQLRKVFEGAEMDEFHKPTDVVQAVKAAVEREAKKAA